MSFFSKSLYRDLAFRWKGTGFGVSAVAWALPLLALTLIVQRSWTLARIEEKVSASAGCLEKGVPALDSEIQQAIQHGRKKVWVCALTGSSLIPDHQGSWQTLIDELDDCQIRFLIMHPYAPGMKWACKYFERPPLRDQILVTLHALSGWVRANKVTVSLLGETPPAAARYYAGGARPPDCWLGWYLCRGHAADRPWRRLNPTVEGEWLSVFEQHLKDLFDRGVDWDGDTTPAGLRRSKAKLFEATSSLPEREGGSHGKARQLSVPRQHEQDGGARSRQRGH